MAIIVQYKCLNVQKSLNFEDVFKLFLYRIKFVRKSRRETLLIKPVAYGIYLGLEVYWESFMNQTLV